MLFALLIRFITLIFLLSIILIYRYVDDSKKIQKDLDLLGNFISKTKKHTTVIHIDAHDSAQVTNIGNRHTTVKDNQAEREEIQALKSEIESLKQKLAEKEDDWSDF